MLAGHLAVALAAKQVEPRVPLAAAVASAFALDLAWPILLLVGIESVHVDPGNTAFTNLAFDAYPWSHSLGMVLIWSVLAAALGRGALGSWRSGGTIGALVLSHWILDWVTHRPDLPLWPNGPMAGLGLWNSIPGTIVVEGGLLLVGIRLYTGATDPTDRTGTRALIGLLVLTGLVWVTQPWAPPPPSSTAVAWGALVLWLLLPWASWIEGHRRAKAGAAGGVPAP